jgi:hypothetical protein
VSGEAPHKTLPSVAKGGHSLTSDLLTRQPLRSHFFDHSSAKHSTLQMMVYTEVCCSCNRTASTRPLCLWAAISFTRKHAQIRRWYFNHSELSDPCIIMGIICKSYLVLQSRDLALLSDLPTCIGVSVSPSTGDPTALCGEVQSIR